MKAEEPGRMRRRSPRPVSHALDALTATLAPATLLAEVQRAWPAAAGEAFAPHAVRFRERDGEVFVACPQAVWAQELDLMSELVVERLNGALGRPAVVACGVQARGPPIRLTRDGQFLRDLQDFCYGDAGFRGGRLLEC